MRRTPAMDEGRDMQHGTQTTSDGGLRAEDVLREALREFHAGGPLDGDDDRMGRRAAVRGLMVRLGLYGAFAAALREDRTPAPAAPGRPDTLGPYEGRTARDMPTSCCDFGVVSLSAGRELCRTWTENDARAIAAVMNAAATSDRDEAADPDAGETADDRIADAVQAMSETHRSWESRCHAVMAALGVDFGRMDGFLPDEDPSA